jgi:hypothetical protein
MITMSKSSWPSKFLQHFPITPLRIYAPWKLGFCPYMRAILLRMLLLVSLLPFPASLVYEFCIKWHDALPGSNTFLEAVRFCFSITTIMLIFGWLMVWYILPAARKAINTTASFVSSKMQPSRSSADAPKKKMNRRERIYAETDRRYYIALQEWRDAWDKMKPGDPTPSAPDWALIYSQVKDEQRSGFAKMLLAFCDSLKKGLCPTVNWVD